MENSRSDFFILETRRLLLRRQETADIPALVDLWSDPEVTRHMGGARDQAWLQTTFAETAATPFADEWDLWPVIEKATGQVIGHCGLLDKEVDARNEIELTYVFAKQAWGQGFAAEMACALRDYAFQTLNLARLIALIELDNQASERVAVKAGMHYEKEVIRPRGALRKVYAVEREPGS